MALAKKIVNEFNGLEANYHRIISFSRNNKNIDIIIRAYTSKDYRDKEKQIELTNTLWESRRAEIEEIIAKPINERMEEEQNLYEEAMEVLNYVQSEKDCFLYDNLLSFSEEYVENDFSINKLYTVLKTIDPYTGAEDA